MVYRGGRGGWQEGGGGKGGGHHETNGRGGGGQDRSRRNQGPRQPGRRPREKSMAWVPPNSARWAPRPMTLPVIMQAARSVAQSVREGGGASEAWGGEEGWGGSCCQVLGLHQEVRRLCPSDHRVHGAGRIWLRRKTFDGFETT